MLPLKPRRYKVVPGRHYGTPTEIWGFRTAAHRGRPVELARAFLRANQSLFKLEGVMPRLRTHHVIESVGARHVILQQRHLGLRIHRASFEHAPDADERENGKIWSATLWDIRRGLGRAIADRIIIESHFQLDGFTTFARGARGLLDADRNLYRGRHLVTLRRILAARGIGPV